MSLDIGPDRSLTPALAQEQRPDRAAQPTDPGIAVLQQVTNGAIARTYGPENADAAGARLEELGHFDRERAVEVMRDNPEVLGPVQNRAAAAQLAEALPSIYASTDIARPPVTAETVERDGVTYAVEGLDRVRDERGETHLVGSSNETAIAYLDRERGFPYTFHVRAFHPSPEFGGYFSGDNRGFSTSLDATSRVEQTIRLNTASDSLTATDSSSPSHHPWFGTKTGNPEGGTIGHQVISQSEAIETHAFRTYVQGANPLTPGIATPNIDVDGQFTVTEDLVRGRLEIQARFTGDDFPNTEAFVTDRSGQSVFIAVAERAKGGITNLPGENEFNPIMNAELEVHLNADGNFTGVTSGGREYSTSEWNRYVTGNPQ